jgi:hypothetical protein
MKALAGRLVAMLIGSAPLLAQERDRSLERISLALQQPLPIVRDLTSVESAPPRTLGIFTLVPPQLPGEIIRVSVPIGELVSQAFRDVAAANQRRQEAAARRRVAAELKQLASAQTR